jgi:hypothetical protein
MAECLLCSVRTWNNSLVPGQAQLAVARLVDRIRSVASYRLISCLLEVDVGNLGTPFGQASAGPVHVHTIEDALVHICAALESSLWAHFI